MIKISGFTGLAPRIDPRKLPENAAQTAREVRLLDGNLNPLHDPAALAGNPTVVVGCKSFYPYNSAYLSWTVPVSVVPNPLVNDTWQRVYYTGDGAPKYAAIDDGSGTLSGVAGSTVQRQLGVPAPTTALTATSVPKSSVSWTQRWYAFWEETDASTHDPFEFDLGTDVTTTLAGAEYVLTDGGALPPNGLGTGTLVVWFEAYSSTGLYLGKCYPSTSAFSASTDLVVNGAAVTCTNSVGATSVTVNLQYNTSRQSGFEATRVYVQTWVTDVGEESAPGDPTTLEVSPVQDVDLVSATNRPYTWVTHKRIYRSVYDSSGQSTLRLCSFSGVTDIPYNTSNLTDSLLDEELELDVLATEGFDPPPDALDMLAAMPGGFLAGAVGRTVYLSEPNLPYAWPYQTTLDADVVATAVADNSLIAVTTEHPYVITGLTPDGMAQAKLPWPMAGTSKRGIASWMGRVFYTSPDGLVEVSGGAARLVTDGIISREYWQALGPTTMRMYTHDNVMLVASDTLLLVFTFTGGAITFTDSALVVAAGYLDVSTDTLQVVLSGQTAIKEFDPPAGTARTFTWRGRDAYYPAPQKMGAYRLQAKSYPQTLRVYSEGSLAATVTVADGKAHLLPSIPPAKVWSVAVESNDDVYSVETGATIMAVMS